jgi:polyisoprenoid-binding protein YceI
MKRSINFLALLMVVAVFASCKGDKTDKAQVGEATEVNENKSAGDIINVNPDVVQIVWTGSKPLKSHTGTLKISEGTIETKDDAIVGGTFIIDMNSLTNTDLEGDMKENLEAHLKGTASGKEDDFFNVAKYPTAKFEFTKMTKLANDPNANALVYGNLTIRDITKEIGFKATVNVAEQGARMHAPEFSINRTDWGIKFMSKNFFDDLKDNFVDDEIKLSITFSAFRDR